MFLSELSIKRPVLATVMSLVVALVGIVSFGRLSVREYPSIDVPVVTVETLYQGASADIMESQVTRPLEDSLSGIEGIDVMTSISRPEASQVTVRFRPDRDPDGAASDVRDRVSRARGELPRDVEEPVVSKAEADAQPIIWLSVMGEGRDPLELAEMTERLVRDRVATLPGVSNVVVFGARRYAMRIWLDVESLAARGLTVGDVESAIRAQNAEIPAGRIEGQSREFTVVSQTDLETPSQFRDIVLREDATGLVRVGDVARVELGPADERQITRFSGRAAIGLGLVRQSTANPLTIARNLREMMPGIQAQLPPGVELKIGYDSTLFIDASIRSVYETILEAVVLVVLVIFLFLRSWRASMVPVVTIPVSLVGAFALMYAFGFTINTLTLLALVLAIGLVVDDAIVMLENIYRHVEKGMPPMQAALTGSREIGFAVIAMTITLAAVFAPIAFTEGQTGKLFVEFALALAGAVLVSGFVALSLSPMMCSRLLRRQQAQGAFYRLGERMLQATVAGYGRALRRALDARPAVVTAGAATLGIGFLLVATLPSELSPMEDRGVILGIFRTPQGSTIEYADAKLRQVEAIWASVPEADRYFAAAGFPVVTSGFTPLMLKDWKQRERSVFEIAAEVGPQLRAVPGADLFALTPPSLGQGFVSRPVDLVLQSSGSYEELARVADAVVARMMEDPEVVYAESDLQLAKPEIALSMNRDKVASIGSDVTTVGRTLETMIGGRKVTRFQRGSDQYDVILQAERAQRSRPADLASGFVRGTGGEMVSLANLVDIEETVAPPELNHFNKLRSARIQAILKPGASVGAAIERGEQIVREEALSGIQVDYAGMSREFRESGQALLMTFVLALLFIYLVLAAQFESWVDPFIILLSVPLALTGGLLAQKVTGGSLNIYSQIGLITLVGLVSKHGILIVDFANRLQREGRDRVEAVIESASLRLRPILMTTGAMVFGALPLALASGAGAQSRQQIGWVIVGGMSLGTLLTLFVVPTVYTLIGRRLARAPAA
jgi:multidrug efflux pump